MDDGPIRIAALEDEDEMRSVFMRSGSLLKDAMDFDLMNPRAHVVDPEITHVEYQGDMVHLHYKYSWSVYNGCDNMDDSGIEQEVITGLLEEDFWVFQRHVPQEPRSTFEEF